MEYLILLIVICLQLVFFYSTYRQTRILIDLYPDVSSNFNLKRIKTYAVNNQIKIWNELPYLRELSNFVEINNGKWEHEKWILFFQTIKQRYKDVIEEELGEELEIAKKIYQSPEFSFKEVEIIKPDSAWNDDFAQVVNETNDYLITNKGSAIDFNIIKGISERKSDEIENSIFATIAVPLYLGLIGTMLGIVVGIFKMDVDIQDLKPETVSFLLGGVKIAMIASIFGLGMTLINNAVFFKNAKFERDKEQNHYYNFIQKKLLPVVSTDISQNVAKQLGSIAESLAVFNREFSVNNLKFKESMHEIHGILSNSTQYIDRLQKVDKSLKPINDLYITIASSVEKFEKFSQYQTSLIEVITHSTVSMQNAEKVFDKIAYVDNNMTTIFREIQDKIVAANEVVKLIKFQYSGIESVTDYAKIQVSEQQRKLSQIYEEFENFIKGMKLTFSDWVKNSVSDAKQEMRTLQENLKDNIDKSFDSVQTKIDTVYSNDNIDLIQQSVNSLKSEVKDLKSKTVEFSQISQITSAISKLSYSVDTLQHITKELAKKTTGETKTPIKLLLKKTLIQGVVFGGVFLVLYFLVRLISNLV